MTIREDSVTLWDDGERKLYAIAVPEEYQYRYTAGKPCITVGFVYKDSYFQGYDCFAFFDECYVELMKSIEQVYQSLEGNVRLYDMGADTDGFIEISASKSGRISIHGQLGASFSDFLLKFQLNADQTLLNRLLDCINLLE